MFLVRTPRTMRGTASASVALAHLKAMQTAGQSVKVTNFGGRRISSAELERAAGITDPRTKH